MLVKSGVAEGKYNLEQDTVSGLSVNRPQTLPADTSEKE